MEDRNIILSHTTVLCYRVSHSSIVPLEQIRVKYFAQGHSDTFFTLAAQALEPATWPYALTARLPNLIHRDMYTRFQLKSMFIGRIHRCYRRCSEMLVSSSNNAVIHTSSKKFKTNNIRKSNIRVQNKQTIN
jgi:hypothetical protein